MIIEIIGPAGAGKSTLSKALAERFEHVRLETPPSFRRGSDIPFFIRNSFSLLPFLSRIYLHKNGRYPSWEQFIFMEMLNGWHQVLNQKAHQEDTIFVLDQGPVYMLTILTLFGQERIKPNNLKKWWDRAFHRWAETLDLVIWLDTSLPELVDRIRAREIWHGVKDKGDVAAYQYLESYRQAYESVIARLITCSDQLKVVRVDTGQSTLEETVKKSSLSFI